MKADQSQLFSPQLGLMLGLALFAVLGLFARPPLESSRPPRSSAAGAALLQPGTAEARLWEDPIRATRALYGHEDGAGHFVESSAVVRDRVARLCEPAPNPGKPAAPKLLVLPVLLPGGGYQSDHETRLRTRFAVLSALGVGGYKPVSSNRLHCLCVGEREGRPELLVPLEWWEHAGGDLLADLGDLEYQDVLVLWIDESRLGRMETSGEQERPLVGLARILAKVFAGQPVPEAGSQPLWDTRVLGPVTSNGLINFLNDIALLIKDPDHPRQLCCEPHATEFAYLRHAGILSQNATIPYPELVGQLSRQASELVQEHKWQRLSDRQIVEGAFQKLDIDFTRTTTTDERVAEALLEELDRRSHDGGDGKIDILLITEFDTAYGRAWRENFETARSTSKRYSPERFHLRRLPINYLRGMDGLTARATEDAKTDAWLESMGSALTQLTGLEVDSLSNYDAVPLGPAQTDYLQRLQMWLQYEEPESVDGDGFFEPDAIGIMGTDFYDRLLILRALKSSFPRATFFTVDLDARLMSAAEYPWTRSLVVASHYGLRLRDKLQRSIPPFRDSYQTAAYFATLKALAPTLPPDNRAPRIYEVSRTGAYDLSVSDSPESGRDPQPAGRRETSWLYRHPDRALMLVLAAALFFALLYYLIFAGQRPRDSEDRLLSSAGGRIGVGLYALAFLALILSIWRSHRTPDGEPFSLYDGISVWPTEILRFLALGLCLYAFWRLPRMLSRSAVRVETQCVQPPPGPGIPSSADPAERADAGIPGKKGKKGKKRKGKPEKNAKNGRKKGASKRKQAGRVLDCAAEPAGSPAPTPHVDPQGAERPTLRLRVSRFLNGVLDVGWPPRWFRALDERQLEHVWEDYREKGYVWSRIGRAGVLTIAYFACGSILIQIFGRPVGPARGQLAQQWDKWLTLASVLAMILLIMFVVDAIRLGLLLMRRLGSEKLAWNRPRVRQVTQETGLDESSARRVLSLQLIGASSEVLLRLVYWPTAVIVLMILARSTVFDDWKWPVPLVLVVACSFALVLLMQGLLRYRAWTLRRRVITSLRSAQLAATRDAPRKAALSGAISYVEGYREGAFASLLDDPLLKALLIPLTVLSGVAILESGASPV